MSDFEDDFDQREIFKPQPGWQTHFLRYYDKFNETLSGGGRGSGKSYAQILAWEKHHQRYGKHAAGLVLRRTYPELEHFIKTACSILPKIGWVYRKGSKKFINKRTGAELKMRFMENDADAMNFQGHEYTMIIIEEAGMFPSPDPIDKLKATLRSAAGVPCRMLLTANPAGPGNDWLKERFVDPAPLGFTPIVTDKGLRRYYLPSTVEDNKILLENDPTYKDTLKSIGPEWLVRAWLLGDWTVSPNGNVFHRHFWRYYDYNFRPVFSRIIHSWDTGFKKGKNNDRSACTIWGVADSGYYLLDAWAARVEFPELKRKVADLAALHRPHIIYIEDKASGQSLYQELKRETLLPVRAVKVDGDKLARAFSVTPLIESGRVFLPSNQMSWKHDFIEELASFPKGKHDDYVDSVSQALDRIAHYQNSLENLQGNNVVVPFNRNVWTF